MNALGSLTRAARLRYGVLAVLLVAAPVCRRAEAPTVPAVKGPESGRPGDTLVFFAMSQHRDQGELAYLFDWGDGSGTGWGPELLAGDTFRQQHAYRDSGHYPVRVRARDRLRLESEWSPVHLVDVGFKGPLTPTRPAGPTQTFPDTAIVLLTRAGHVRGESVSVQFDWGDTLGEWSAFAAAGAEFPGRHVYCRQGSFAVRARAQDRAGEVSPWSESETIQVVRRPLEPPRRLRLAASAGVMVRLSWDRGRNPDSTRYQVWFRPGWSGDFALAGAACAGSLVHDPAGETGDYTVSAWFEDEELSGPDTLSTIPVFTDTLTIGELNTPESAGYGWDSVTRLGRPGSMRDTGAAGLVDFYLTDLAPGHLGPSYYLASPCFGPDDPGGVVPPGPWRETRMVGVLGSPQEPLPEFDSLLYQRVVDVSSFIAHVAVHTPEGHYALVTTYGPDLNRGTIPVCSWFQPVRGLRLIRHPESGPGSPPGHLGTKRSRAGVLRSGRTVGMTRGLRRESLRESGVRPGASGAAPDSARLTRGHKPGLDGAGQPGLMAQE
jgi:hypothetical protein